MNNKSNALKLIPVMFCFFAMGFVDLVGIATNYVKADLSLSDTEANIFPILAKVSSKRFFIISVIMLALGMSGLFFADTKIVIYVCVALIGFGNSNVFSIIFSQALLHKPHKQNEVSGLMIMGLFGGTIFPLIMGIASDAMLAQNGAVLVMIIGVLYLLFLTQKIKS